MHSYHGLGNKAFHLQVNKKMPIVFFNNENGNAYLAWTKLSASPDRCPRRRLNFRVITRIFDNQMGTSSPSQQDVAYIPIEQRKWELIPRVDKSRGRVLPGIQADDEFATCHNESCSQISKGSLV